MVQRAGRAWLRSRNRVMWSGMPLVAADRNAPAPGRRIGGCACRAARNAPSSWRAPTRWASISRVPWSQVSIVTATMAVSTSGYQPPSNTFTLLAARNTRSISRNTPLTAKTSSGLKPQRRAMRAASNVVIAISSETAMP